MAITSAESATVAQTSADAYATAFDAKALGVLPASIFKVEALTNGWTVRINSTREVAITPGTIDYLQSIEPGGIHTLEIKNYTPGSNGTGLWASGLAV